MRMFLNFSTLEKSMGRRNIVPVTYSMCFGCLVFLCKGLKVKDFGYYFALMRLLAWQIVGVMNLRNCIPNMRERARPKSIQQNLGTIESSNLCSEIIEYTSPRETAVCKGKSYRSSYCKS